MLHVTRCIMYLPLVALMCLAVTSSSINRPVAHRSTIAAPDDESYMNGLFTWIARHQESLLETLQKILLKHKTEAETKQIIQDIRLSSTADTEACEGCQLKIATLNALIASGLTYADLRPEAIEYCIRLEQEAGINGTIICPGVNDRYYPHAFYILGAGNFSSEYVCQKLNTCSRLLAPTFSHNRVAQPTSPRHTRPRSLENTIRMIHLSDAHVEKEYLEGSATDCGLPVCCRGDNSGEGSAGHWGDYNCNVPPRTTELLLEKIAEAQPHFIVYTGDSPPHVRWLETLTSQIQVTEWLTSAISRHLPGIKVYPSIGNHEIYPADMYYTALEDIQIFNGAFATSWAPVAQFDDTQINTIKTAGYYAAQVMPGLRVINYNSNYGYTYNWYNILNEHELEYQDMVQFVVQNLQEARDSGEKVILNSHHPYGAVDHIVEDAHIWNPIIHEYSDVIVYQPIGHHHIDDFKVFFDAEGVPRSVQVLNQAMQTLADVNPGFRVVHLDPVTFTALDYEQYTMNLTAQTGDEPDVSLLYRASEEYGLADLTAQSYAELVDRFETDDELFQQFLYNMKSRSIPVEPCVAECKHEKLCWFRHTDYTSYQLCVSDYTPPL